MEITFRAKIKAISAKEGGTVIQLEPQASYAKQIVELMPKVGLYAYIAVEDEQMEIQDLEAEYEQPTEGQTEIDVEAETLEYDTEPMAKGLPVAALPEGEVE